MINTYYFTNRVLKGVFNINLDSHHIKLINYILTITAKILEIQIIHDINKPKEMAYLYARLVNQ